MGKEKRKIWIEKLIRYLLESKWEEYKGEYYEWYRDVELEQNIDSLSELKPFIKWLVENEKIDFSREWDLSNELVNLFGRKLDNAEWVIALLSIQDEPIRFLCEILK